MIYYAYDRVVCYKEKKSVMKVEREREREVKDNAAKIVIEMKQGCQTRKCS